MADKVGIHYYSGAGNTQCIANKLARAFEGRAFEVAGRRITQDSLHAPDEKADILGVGFPIYFREAPDMVYEFLRASKGQGRPVFFFCTKGLYSGNAIRNVMEFAAEMSFEPIGFGEFVMPGTDFLTLFAKKDSLSEKILKSIHSRDLDGKINRFTKEIALSNKGKKPRRKWYTFFDNGIKKFKEIQDNYYKDYIGQFHSDAQTCVKCGECVRSCPRNNILLGAQISFGMKCDFCLRCINHCPTESIQIGKVTRGKARYNPLLA